MKEVGTIVDFSEKEKALVELEGKGGCDACQSGGMCAKSGEGVRRMTLDVIPGIARGTHVIVEVGRRSLLKMPTLAYLMIAAFVAGTILGQVIFKAILGVSKSDVISILAGLIATAGSIAALSVIEGRRNKQVFEPRIIGIVLKEKKGTGPILSQ